MSITRSAVALYRTFGWRGVGNRTVFELRRRTSALRAEPAEVREIHVAPLPKAWPFTPNVEKVRHAAERTGIERAQRVLQGEYDAYRWMWLPRPAEAEAWLRHPHSGHVYPRDLPWWRVSHFDPRAGDIKDIWEPARFTWMFDLARGWLVTGDERYAACARDGVLSFLESAPPFRGVHWACGQETSIRAMAWLWAEGAFATSESFSTEFRTTLLRALAWSGERIADAFRYAKSQRNNHGVSEATGLICIGARLRDLDSRADRWIDRGHHGLEMMIADQIASDGWYVQHSFNYARLALDQLTMARRALRAAGRDLSAGARARVRSLVELLGTCMDASTGELPNHGANDGAYVLPLSTRAYRDFRPSLTAGAAAYEVTLPAACEPEREVLAWLDEAVPPPTPVPAAPTLRVGSSGWVVARSRSARLFARAGAYGSRPGHIDPCHVDIWIRDEPIAIDAGTYRYAAPPPWSNALADIAVHNTVQIPSLPAAQRGPRFLWLTWPRAHIVGSRVEGERIVLELINESWKHAGVLHRRHCDVGPDLVRIVDEISAPAAFVAPIHVQWLLGQEGSVVMECASAHSVDEVYGDEQSVRGWESPLYAQKIAARSVRLTAVPRNGTLRVLSTISRRRHGAARAVGHHADTVTERSCST